MNLENFSMDNLGRFDLGSLYFSKSYNKEFPILPPMTSGNGKTYICKLEAMKKQEIKDGIQAFVSKLPGYTVYPNWFNDSDSFYESPRAHQFYHFRLPFPGQHDCFNIYFRTKSDSDKIEDYLDAIQEAEILSTITRPSLLKDLAKDAFGEELKKITREVGGIAEREREANNLLVDAYDLTSHIGFHGVIRLNAYNILRLNGYSVFDIISIGRSVEENEGDVKRAIVDSFNLDQ